MTGEKGADRTDSTLEDLFYHTDRIPLVYWRGFSGARTAVLVVGATTAVSFVATRDDG